MLREKRDFRALAKIRLVGHFEQGRGVVEDTNVCAVTPLRDDDPHALALHLNGAVLVLALDVEDQTDRLAALKRFALGQRRDPERVRIRPMGGFPGSQLPVVSLNAGESHVLVVGNECGAQRTLCRRRAGRGLPSRGDRDVRHGDHQLIVDRVHALVKDDARWNAKRRVEGDRDSVGGTANRVLGEGEEPRD
jgi:hypothetical protein